MHTRQGGHHAGIALVGHGGHGPVFGHGEVAAADAHVRRDELAAQLHAGHLDQLLDVGVLLFARGLGEVVGHLVTRKMDGGHDHVRGAFMAQLDDPFAQVRLVHNQAFGLQRGIELDFLGGHGFGFDHPLDVVFLGDAGDDLIGFLGRGRAMHVHAALFRLLLELLVEFLHVLAGVVLGFGYLGDEAALVHFLEDGFAVGPVGHGKGVQSAAQKIVLQGLIDLLAVIGKRFGGFMHGLSPPEE